MTQPLTPDQQPVAGVPVQLGATVIPGPDGQPWQARRAKLGLFVADGKAMPQMPPVNGRGPNGHARG